MHKAQRTQSRLPAGALRWGVLFMVELYGGEVDEKTAAERLRACTGLDFRSEDLSRIVSKLVAERRLRVEKDNSGRRVFKRRQPRSQYSLSIKRVRAEFTKVRRALAKAQRLMEEGVRQ